MNSPLFAMPAPAPVEPRHPMWPLWVVYAAGVLTGVAILIGSVSAAVMAAPATAAGKAALFVGMGAVVGWLLTTVHYFWPFRRGTAGLALLWGAVVAVEYALLANVVIFDHFSGDRGFAPAWPLLAPFAEEPMKDLGVLVVLLLAATRPRTALDGLVVGSFVGLGFEVVDNVIQSINAAEPVIDVFVHRGWTGHIVITGIAGFGIAYVMTGRAGALQRWGIGMALVLLAFTGNALSNTQRFGPLFLLGQIGMLLFYLWLIRVGRTQEAALYPPYLSYVEPSLIDPALAESVVSGKARKAYRDAQPSPGEAKSQQLMVARLCAAIGNGDVGRAHECAEGLAAVSR